MVTRRLILIMTDRRKGSVVRNYRPITSLSKIWKILRISVVKTYNIQAQENILQTEKENDAERVLWLPKISWSSTKQFRGTLKNIMQTPL